MDRLWLGAVTFGWLSGLCGMCVLALASEDTVSGAGVALLWGLGCLGVILLLERAISGGILLCKRSELKKLGRVWRVLAVLVGWVYVISNSAWLMGLGWLLVGGDELYGLVYGGLLGVLFSFVAASVVIGANQRVGFYCNSGEEPETPCVVAESEASGAPESDLVSKERDFWGPIHRDQSGGGWARRHRSW